MEAQLFDLLRIVVETALSFMVPLILGVTLASLLVGILQAVTSIREETISFAGRATAVFVIISSFGPSLVDRIRSLAEQAWSGGITP